MRLIEWGRRNWLMGGQWLWGGAGEPGRAVVDAAGVVRGLRGHGCVGLSLSVGGESGDCGCDVEGGVVEVASQKRA